MEEGGERRTPKEGPKTGVLDVGQGLEDGKRWLAPRLLSWTGVDGLGGEWKDGGGEGGLSLKEAIWSVHERGSNQYIGL